MKKLLYFTIIFIIFSCQNTPKYDTIIRNGLVYDGNGEQPYQADIAIANDNIAFIGDLKNETAKNEIDANDKAVTPGFINMLSWAVETLIEDGNSQSDIHQGVTLEVFGEGNSMGPLNVIMKNDLQKSQGDIKYKIGWNTLGEYMHFLEQKGISPNVASFVGATTLRTHVIGEDDRAPTVAELEKMKALVRQAMQEGALGIGSSLIYPPAFFAKTEELIALCKEAGKYGGSI